MRLTVPFKPDIPFLLKTFLIFTNNEKAIIKTCSLLETVRQADPKSTIDHEIEESNISLIEIISHPVSKLL